jgi:hypothetical protein
MNHGSGCDLLHPHIFLSQIGIIYFLESNLLLPWGVPSRGFQPCINFVTHHPSFLCAYDCIIEVKEQHCWYIQMMEDPPLLMHAAAGYIFLSTKQYELTAIYLLL